MPALRYKWQGSKIQIMTAFGATDHTISAIANADPAVITFTGATLVDGDCIMIHSAGGMTEVNNQVYLVYGTTATTAQLFGVDSTSFGTYTSGGKFNQGTYSDFCELTNYNRQGGTSPEIDATTVCSDATEYEIGLPNFGTTALDFNFAP